MEDKTDSDLRRFMFDDIPDNVADLRAKLKEQQSISDVAKVRGSKVVERSLFSDAVNKELAKYRPNYKQRRRDVATFGLAFSGLAMFSFLMLPEPLNWVMASGCLIPFAVPLFKYKMAKRRVRHP